MGLTRSLGLFFYDREEETRKKKRRTIYVHEMIYNERLYKKLDSRNSSRRENLKRRDGN